MNQKDRQIIRALQRNGRMTNQELSLEVNLSPSPCLRRLRQLEETGVIKGYAAEIDAKSYGLAVTVFVRVKLKDHKEETIQRFEQSVASTPEILECYLMTGQSDYLLRVLVKDLESYEVFVRSRLHSIGEIGSMDSSFVYGTIKKTSVFPAMN